MDFERTYTESELDPAALEFARSLRERPMETPRDMNIDGFGESLGARLLRLFRGRQGLRRRLLRHPALDAVPPRCIN